MDREIKVLGFYRHFKGHIYQVIALAYDSEKYDQKFPDQARVVVYQNVDDKKIWVRPYEMFNSLVDNDKYPECTQICRFEEISNR